LLVRSLKNPDATIRATIIWALGKIGKAAAEAIPALLEAVERDTDPSVRRRAAWALKKIRRNSELGAE
jgi:HEAT repeat protein